MENAAVATTLHLTRALGSLPLIRALKPAAKMVLLAAAFAKVDCFIASYPKSGRTWLRFILANYLNEIFGLGLKVDFHSMFHIIPNSTLDRDLGSGVYRFHDRAGMPFLAASHDTYQRVLFLRRSIIFILRDPKDTLVSRYFHKTQHYHDFAGSINEFLRDPQYGVQDYIHYLNGWAEALDRHRHLVVTYEQLSASPPAVVQTALGFLGVQIDHAALDRAVGASSFDAMRAVEITHGLPTRDYDRDQENSLRVRRGQIGGFRNYLDSEEVAYVERSCTVQLSEKAKHLLARADIALSARADGELARAYAPAQA